MTVDRAGTAPTRPQPVWDAPVVRTDAAPQAFGRYTDRTDPSLAEHRAQYAPDHPLNLEWRYVVAGRLAGVPVREGADVEAIDGRIDLRGGIPSGTTISWGAASPSAARVDQFLAKDPADFTITDHPEGIARRTEHGTVELRAWMRAPEAPGGYLELVAVAQVGAGETAEAATRRVRQDVAGLFPAGTLVDPMQVGLQHVDVSRMRSFGGNAPDGAGRMTNLASEVRVPVAGELSNAPIGATPHLKITLSPSHDMTLSAMPKTQSSRRRWYQRESTPEPVPWIEAANVIPTRFGRLQIHRPAEGLPMAFWQGFLATEPRRQVTFMAQLTREEAQQPPSTIAQDVETIVRRVLPHEHLLAGAATQL